MEFRVKVLGLIGVYSLKFKVLGLGWQFLLLGPYIQNRRGTENKNTHNARFDFSAEIRFEEFNHASRSWPVKLLTDKGVSSPYSP